MYFENIINSILLTVDVTDPNSNNGSTVMPFLGFVMFLLGIVMIFVGLILTNAAKREWNVFYAPYDTPNGDIKAKRKKSVIKGRAVYILGIIVLAASFFIK